MRQVNQDKGLVVKARGYLGGVVGLYEMHLARAHMAAPVSTGPIGIGNMF